jgi:hypothetical protein
VVESVPVSVGRTPVMGDLPDDVPVQFKVFVGGIPVLKEWIVKRIQNLTLPAVKLSTGYFM